MLLLPRMFALPVPLTLVVVVAVSQVVTILAVAGVLIVLIVSLGCLAIVVPLALQLAHVLPASYAERGEALAVFPFLVRFWRGTPLILAFGQASFVVAACVVFRRFRGLLQSAEERLFVTMWQLRQVVPREATSGLSAPPASQGPRRFGRS